MKIAALIFAFVSISALSQPIAPPGFCEVRLCNGGHRPQAIGDICWVTEIPKSLAVKGTTIPQSSKWFQGIHVSSQKPLPTLVKDVGRCN